MGRSPEKNTVKQCSCKPWAGKHNIERARGPIDLHQSQKGSTWAETAAKSRGSVLDESDYQTGGGEEGPTTR